MYDQSTRKQHLATSTPAHISGKLWTNIFFHRSCRYPITGPSMSSSHCWCYSTQDL